MPMIFSGIDRDVAERGSFPLDEGSPLVMVIRNTDPEGNFVADTGDNCCDLVLLFDEDSADGAGHPDILIGRSLPMDRYQRKQVEKTGAANYIASGYYERAWVRGRHKGYPALRQHEAFLIWRSADMDLHRDDATPEDDWNESRIVADNMHGFAPYSAGCVAVLGHMGRPMTEDWAKVYDWVYNKHASETYFAALILEHDDLSDHASVRYGSVGGRVRQLQKRLTDHGIDVGPVDGIFGRRTHDSVRELQRKFSEHDNGIWRLHQEQPAA